MKCKMCLLPLSAPLLLLPINVVLSSPAISRFLLTWLNILRMLMELALYGFWMQLKPVALSTLWSSTKPQQVNSMGKCKKYPRRRQLLFILGHRMVRIHGYSLVHVPCMFSWHGTCMCFCFKSIPVSCLKSFDCEINIKIRLKWLEIGKQNILHCSL